MLCLTNGCKNQIKPANGCKVSCKLCRVAHSLMQTIRRSVTFAPATKAEFPGSVPGSDLRRRHTRQSRGSKWREGVTLPGSHSLGMGYRERRGCPDHPQSSLMALPPSLPAQILSKSKEHWGQHPKSTEITKYSQSSAAVPGSMLGAGERAGMELRAGHGAYGETCLIGACTGVA